MCLLHEPNHDTPFGCARFIGDTANYGPSQLFATTIAKDRELLTWRAGRPRMAQTEPRVEHRVVWSLALSAVVGVIGPHVYPFPAENAVLSLVRLEGPIVYAGFATRTATVWFSTPSFVFNIAFSLLYFFEARGTARRPEPALSRYPAPEHREDLFLVLGELHYSGNTTSGERAVVPHHSERGSHTRVAVIDARHGQELGLSVTPDLADSARQATGLVAESKATSAVLSARSLPTGGATTIEVCLDSPRLPAASEATRHRQHPPHRRGQV